jgi:CheY-like chemotaxis protein
MKKVLIIEDNISSREEIAFILRLEGYKVFEAGNCFQGLNLTEKNIPDLIICDVLLPVFDGYEFLSHLRNSPVVHSTPLIFITGLPSKEFISHMSELEFTGYLKKPFGSKELLTVLDKTLNNNLVEAG